MKRELKPWSIQNSKYLLKDRWITVRADTCITKDGKKISPYYVLEYPHWVHMVVINHKKQILILKQYRHGAKRIFVELPVGTMESSDKNPLAAAKRELLEETGYIGHFKLVGITSPNPATHTNNIYTYIVTNPTIKKAPKNDPSEVTNYTFTNLTSVLSLIKRRKFAQALHIASLFLALQKIEKRKND